MAIIPRAPTVSGQLADLSTRVRSLEVAPGGTGGTVVDQTPPTYVVIYCPGDVQLQRLNPATQSVLPNSPDCIVLWRKATLPLVSSGYAQDLDDYRQWDG